MCAWVNMSRALGAGTEQGSQQRVPSNTPALGGAKTGGPLGTGWAWGSTYTCEAVCARGGLAHHCRDYLGVSGLRGQWVRGSDPAMCRQTHVGLKLCTCQHTHGAL